MKERNLELPTTLTDWKRYANYNRKGSSALESIIKKWKKKRKELENVANGKK